MTKEALKLALETAEGIANSDWRKWEELASSEEFERWVKSRAMHMATALQEALAEQPAQQEPVAWMYTSQWKGDERFITRYQSELMTYKADKVWPLYTAPPAQPEQEPVGPEPFGFFQYDIRLDAWVQNRINNKGVAFYTKEKK